MGGADASTITVLFVQVNMIVKKYQIMDIDMNMGQRDEDREMV